MDIPFFLSPIFFELTARVIPLRSGLRVFCFIGSALNNTGFPPIKQTLACDSKPPRSLSCPKENGAERKVKTKCLISVTLVGFVGADPEQRQAKGNGSKFTVLSVATQRSWKNADDEWSSKTEWHRIVLIWNQRCLSISRGDFKGAGVRRHQSRPVHRAALIATA